MCCITALQRFECGKVGTLPGDAKLGNPTVRADLSAQGCADLCVAKGAECLAMAFATMSASVQVCQLYKGVESASAPLATSGAAAKFQYYERASACCMSPFPHPPPHPCACRLRSRDAHPR